MSSATAEQPSVSCEEHLTDLCVARGVRHTHSPGTQRPHITHRHQPATVLVIAQGQPLAISNSLDISVFPTGKYSLIFGHEKKILKNQEDLHSPFFFFFKQQERKSLIDNNKL